MTTYQTKSRIFLFLLPALILIMATLACSTITDLIPSSEEPTEVVEFTSVPEEVAPPPTALPEKVEPPSGQKEQEPPSPELQGKPINQWANYAVATTQYQSNNWSAKQATGAPDTLECGDLVTAWASESSEGVDTIDLLYPQPVYAIAVNIFQSYSPDQVVLVELIGVDDNQVEILRKRPTVVSTCPYRLQIKFDRTDFLVKGVSITIDQSILGTSWNEIDAVELVGIPAP